MIAKLEELKDRFVEVGQLIVQPDAMSDMKKYSQLSKEYKDLEKRKLRSLLVACCILNHQQSICTIPRLDNYDNPFNSNVFLGMEKGSIGAVIRAISHRVSSIEHSLQNKFDKIPGFKLVCKVIGRRSVPWCQVSSEV